MSHSSYQGHWLGSYGYFLKNTAPSLKTSALGAYPSHGVLLNFSKEYKAKLLESGYSFVAWLPIEAKMSKGMRIADSDDPLKSVYEYHASRIPDTCTMITVISGADGRETKMRILT